MVFSECPGQLVPRQSATAELTFAARAILALDLDTTTSWALRGRDRLITSGTVSFRPGRHDGGGMRYPMMVAVDVKAVAALPASPRSFASHSRWTGVPAFEQWGRTGRDSRSARQSKRRSPWCGRDGATPMTHEEIVALITEAQTRWTTEPERLLPYVNYMARAGLIQQDTDDWRDLFFETVSGGAGS